MSAAFADPRPPLTPERLCKSIDSNKYEAQCTTAIHNATFDMKALIVCNQQKTDYDKKSCVEVIRNKEYTEGNIKDCLKTKKVPLIMCLSNNGVFKATEQEGTDAPAPIDK